MDSGFRKSDLEDGMLVERRDGALCIVSGMNLLHKYGCSTTVRLQDNMLSLGNVGLDIMKVYGTPTGLVVKFSCLLNATSRPVLYERDETVLKEISSIQEQIDQLSLQIESLKDKL